MSNQAALASQWMVASAQRVDQAIETSFDEWNVSAQQLKDAMHYAATGGGKESDLYWYTLQLLYQVSS